MKTLAFVTCLSIASTLLVHAQPSQVLKPSTATKTKDDATATQMGDYKGVKHALGVVDINSDEGFRFEENAKQNMRAMLESALFATNRFVIVERSNLEAVVMEQDLQKSNRAAKSKDVAQTGKLRSARYIAACTVTEASSQKSGDKGGLRIKDFKIGGSATKSAIVLVVKLVDSTTGEVVASERIRGEAGSNALNVGYSRNSWGADVASFAKTPMGQAAQDCINQAVLFIARQMEQFPVEGVVVSATEQNLIINLGENYGIRPGQTFVVRREGEVLIDPSTGELLGKSEGEEIGTLEVTSIREKVSYCKLVDGDMPERGDVVVVK